MRVTLETTIGMLSLTVPQEGAWGPSIWATNDVTSPQKSCEDRKTTPQGAACVSTADRKESRTPGSPPHPVSPRSPGNWVSGGQEGLEVKGGLRPTS